ncbi:MAG: 50S ribosomal protein L15e [Candidatus Aenigmarchaeota archaeon]|nr:50S ribosomal protein L15e [Candidatus Aenigmarchaeota archaeon]
MKSAYKYIEEKWKSPSEIAGHKERVRVWRKEDVVKRAERPTNLSKARVLGYKAKQGYILVRTRMGKGGRHRPKIRKGRRPRRIGRIYFTAGQSMQAIAEKRVARRFPNTEVLNSYYVGEDGQYKYFEIILVDPHHPVIKADPKINWICGQRRRAFRGLTSAAKKSRGL